MKRPGRLTIALVFVVLCLIWGSTWAVIQIGLEGVPPFTGVSIRFLIAAVVMLARIPVRFLIVRLAAIVPFVLFALLLPFIGTGPTTGLIVTRKILSLPCGGASMANRTSLRWPGSRIIRCGVTSKPSLPGSATLTRRSLAVPGLAIIAGVTRTYIRSRPRFWTSTSARR